MATDADINVIALRFGLTGQLPTETRAPMYGDFTGITDYAGAIAAIEQAQEAFMRMPAELRAKLDNDPQKFLEYCSDEKNLEEMRKYGLAKPKPPEPKPDPQKTEEVKK